MNKSLFKKTFNWILDIIFQENCLGCKSKGEIICSKCVVCLRSRERETSSGIMAAYDYRDPIIKNAIWKLKYHRNRHLGIMLGQLLYETMIEEISDIRLLAKGQPILVVPVPLSPKKVKVRGYNQAKAIAENFCDCESEEKIFELVDNVVVKKLDTEPQARISNRNSRLKNVRGVYEITRPDIVKGRIVIVIDDVTTTGATMTEIIKIIKSSGAKKVLGLALAH